VQDFDEKVKLCVDLLCSNSILVLATQGEDGPYTSLMAYSCTSDGREIYMLSSKKSQKWVNIQNNPQVSLLVDDRDGKLKQNRSSIKALTVTGEFIKIDAEKKDTIMKHFAIDNPEINSSFSGPDCDIICIKATSFLLLDGPQQAFHSGKLL